MAFTSFRFASALAGGQLIKHSTTTRQVALNGNIQSRTFYGIYEKYMEAFKRYGWKGTLWKLYNPGDVKFGKLVGEDQFGNKYYEDTTELHGQQRWTEFKVDTFEDFEGSNIPPEWHMWLQQMTDAKPGEPGQDVSLIHVY
jgi:NADH dehydrogenase (ubiquinone) 1 alpha subcomplex subunit 12